MKNLIMNNIGLKILATLLSATMWLIVVNFNDPVITESYTGVKVDILNKEALEEQNKVYKVLEGTDEVTVWVTATRSTFEDLRVENIYAQADLTDVTYMDTVRIQLFTDKGQSEITDMWANVDNLKLEIEDTARSQLVIDTKITGTPKKGYVQGNVSIDQNVVRLTGPDSVISQIAKASVVLDVSGMSATVNTSAELKLYDVDGKEVEDDRIGKNIDRVNVSIEILETKDVPITIELAGEAAQGYIATGEYEVSRRSVTIAGRKSALEAVESIVIPEGVITLTGRVEDVTQSIKLDDYLPYGTRFADEDFNGYVNITVKIEEAIAEILEIPLDNIRVVSQVEGYNAIVGLEGNLSIRVTGIREDIDALKAENMVAIIDLSQLVGDQVASSYMAELKWNVPDSVLVQELETVYIHLESIE